MTTVKEEQTAKIAAGQGFLAALDQSGGSTPKALKLYGVTEDMYTPETMFDRIHEMRSRIMTSKAFTGDRVIGAILFEDTMDRTVDGKPSAEYLWSVKQVVPFLKCDKGLQDLEHGVQLMKPIPGLDDLMKRAVEHGVFGTKMRSVIQEANEQGIHSIVAQQFEIGKQILAHGLVPIIEPEVDIHSPTKQECEEILKAAILKELDALDDGVQVMLKLSLPSTVNFYKECIEHPKCLKVVALSGGYSRDEANAILAQQKDMIGSFSRALTEGLTYQMSDEDFEATLDKTIQSIYEASKAG
ncbi:hypothetical protein ACA910_018747 [Epithemia clementina (nom. ined.)]